MAFGILEPVSSAIPSGTNLLENLCNASDPDGVETRLFLVPKPSDSPLDPLNWPRYKKGLLFSTIIFGACAAGSLGPVLVPGFTAVVILLDVPGLAQQVHIIPYWRRAWKYHFGFGAAKFRNQSRVFKLCIDLVILLAHPAVLWVCLMWSVVFTWIILIGAVVSRIFGVEPYNMSITAVGNLAGIARLIGSTVGTLTAGWACDKIVGYLALRNRGMYEPEFRFLIIIPAFITMAIGGFGLGAAIDESLLPVACGVFMAISNFAVGAGCTGVVAYTNDVCGQRPSEAFGLAMVVKSAFVFGLTFVFNDYYTAAGPLVFS
ncbi:hypothetical protein BPOR_0038g00180 [Botrytis porri]|uniref:Major facilitator superfamily (MFS) profile domain-containing protein n=1 Tax=Botrytis porri TaxID=87229 RepID=A0A4Z1L2R5_9HELO|nr:hypothetical protein BPOR_0038g00180 [Botrytis porri]